MITEAAKSIATHMLKQDEGFRFHMYDDETGKPPVYDGPGKITIGYGLNLHGGISEEEAAILLRHRIARVAALDAQRLIAGHCDIGDVRQAVVVNMAYNMGRKRLSGFKKFLSALREKKFTLAAEEMLDSAWARKLPARAGRLSLCMKNNNLQPYGEYNETV